MLETEAPRKEKLTKYNGQQPFRMNAPEGAAIRKEGGGVGICDSSGHGGYRAVSPNLSPARRNESSASAVEEQHTR